MNLRVEQLCTTEFEEVEGLERRVSKFKLYQDIKYIGSQKLLYTYLNLKRSEIILKRQLRRVSRHLDSLEDHVQHRRTLVVPAVRDDDNRSGDGNGASGRITEDAKQSGYMGDACDGDPNGSGRTAVLAYTGEPNAA